VDEAGALGAASEHTLAAYRYADLGLAVFVATYQAPFLRTSPVGAARHVGTETGYFDQTTLRYRLDGPAAEVSVDGAAELPPDPLPAASPGPKPPKQRYVLDAPFMATVLMLPAFHRRDAEPVLAPVGAAFDASGDRVEAALRPVRANPQSPKTPKSDAALEVEGVATVWFDPASEIVHEAHFDALNLDARLVSYARATRPAPFEPVPTPAPETRLPAAGDTFESQDGTTLDAVIQMPPNVKRPVPIVALIAPGPNAGRNFGGDGPNPMFPDLARAFALRGYAVLRYDTRGVGKSEGSSRTESWEQSLQDATAAVRDAAQADGIDPKRVYVAGYGSGADLALAASAASDVPIAGVVALAPSVVSYRTCGLELAEAGARNPAEAAKAAALFERTAGRISDEIVTGTIDGRPYERSDGTWTRSSYDHDPVALAARAKAPLFVLHPGIPICAESAAQVESYDDRLRAANPRTTIVVASDLTATFGGRYDADSDVDTQEFFPYRFDLSTAGAIADWLDGPKTASVAPSSARGAAPVRAAPPPPPGLTSEGSAPASLHPKTLPTGSPLPRTTLPGQPGLPETLPTLAPQPAPAATPT
jgi:alpha/beta superfamily hydrolase